MVKLQFPILKTIIEFLNFFCYMLTSNITLFLCKIEILIISHHHDIYDLSASSFWFLLSACPILVVFLMWLVPSAIAFTFLRSMHFMQNILPAQLCGHPYLARHYTNVSVLGFRLGFFILGVNSSVPSALSGSLASPAHTFSSSLTNL